MAVYNYKTGEILCMVSAPSYDPLNVPEDIETNDRYEGAYLNRFLSSTFTPGSVYKTVTLTAALEEIPDLFERTWTCTGQRPDRGRDHRLLRHPRGAGHRARPSPTAATWPLPRSPRSWGRDTLEKYTEQAGLTDSYSVSGLPTAAGHLRL